MHTNGTIVIAADLGRLNAYRVVVTEGVDPHESMQVSHVNPENTEKTATHLEPISERDYVEAHGRVSEKMSDKSGNLHNANGEQHGRSEEMERQELETIAGTCSTLRRLNAWPKTWRRTSQIRPKRRCCRTSNKRRSRRYCV
ncbi:MAG: hypothetical protein P8Y65_08705 [Campylobacterales bacterium]